MRLRIFVTTGLLVQTLMKYALFKHSNIQKLAQVLMADTQEFSKLNLQYKKGQY